MTREEQQEETKNRLQNVDADPASSSAQAEVKAQAEQTADVQALQQELDKQKELAKRHLDQWKRSAADMENYRKRVEKERAELVKLGPAGLMRTLLPVLDDFERALMTVPDTLGRLTWIEGVALIERKLQVALEQQGLKEIEALGKPFDPVMHEALLQEESKSCPDGHVATVLQRGYVLHDRVLRPAMVKVARNPGGEQATEPPKAEPEEGEPVVDEVKQAE